MNNNNHVGFYPKEKNIYIIGYYDHKNIGDEQYKSTFQYMFDTFLPKNDLITYNINFLDCDIIKDHNFKDDDIIVLGGGDILNEYFLDQIILKFRNKVNKIIAISVGIPYLDILLDTNKLNIIDYIFIRTKQDLELIKDYFHPHRVFYLPDLSFFLLNTSNILNDYSFNQNSKLNLLIKSLNKIKKSGKKIISISLNRCIIKSPDYSSIINNFNCFIKYLLNFGYHIVFLPFNTNINKDDENDILIHNDIISKLSLHLQSNITNIDFTINPNDILNLYEYFYMTITMRYHACLFSIYKNIPLLPIFTTRKIKNLLTDINLSDEYYYQLPTNNDDLPLNCNNIDIILTNKFANLLKNYKDIQHNLNINCRDNKQSLLNNLINLIINDNAYSKEKLVKLNTIDNKINDLYIKIQNLVLPLADFRKCKDVSIQNLIVQMVSYYLTNGSINSEYNYGLNNKMFKDDYNYYNEWKWVISDNIKKNQFNKKLYNNPYGLFNLNYIDQNDYSGAHRFGWQYVYNNIKYLHNENVDLLLDLYLDRTFHWNKEINKIIGLIPYTKKWCGFIHHTFDTYFSEYNCYNLLKNPDFIESLKYCSCLFVLSKTLQNKLIKELENIGITNIKVISIIHPTETNVKLFNYNNFIQNTDKKIIHIGGWLRNLYSFYKLTIPNTLSNNTNYLFKLWTQWLGHCQEYKILSKSNFKIRKVALKGVNMNNYFPEVNFYNNFSMFLTSEEKYINKNTKQNVSQNISGNASVNSLTNNWYKDFSDDVKYMINSLDIINTLSDNEYDKLLTENIIFINLIDASAVNTVIECIVRNTPIIINKHPAIIELLGDKYPLYFSNSYSNYYEFNNSVLNILTIRNIKKATKYLSNLNKKNLKISNFIKNFITEINKLN